MPLITILSGSENNRQASAAVYVFHSPTCAERNGLGEVPLPKLARDGARIGDTLICARHGNLSIVPAVEGTREEIGGAWYQQTYDVKEGELLKIFASVKPEWNKQKNSANLFVRVRERAPFVKIRIRLLGRPTSKVSVAEFVGRMDILTVEDAKERGAKIQEAYAHTFQKSAVEKLFSAEELEPAIAPRPEIAVVGQGEDKVRIRRRGRVIEI